MTENPDHDELDEPYEDITMAMAMIRAAAELLVDHPVSGTLESLANRLNRERLNLLGNGTDRPFFVSDIIKP